MLAISNSNYQAYRSIISKTKINKVVCLKCETILYDYKKITVQKQSGRITFHDNRVCYDCNVQNNYGERRNYDDII